MRRAAWGLGGLLGLLAVLVAAVVGMANTAAGFRWLAGAATTLSRGQLTFEGVEGHLGMPIRIQRLILASDRRRVSLEGVRLEWRPHALWQRRLDVDLLAVQHLRVDILKQATLPPPLPVSLRLPLDVRVAAWDVAQLDVVDAGKTISFSRLHGTLDGSGDRYRVAAAATAQWAEMGGQFEIRKDAPFRLHGRIDGLRNAPLPIRARLDLSGQLAALAFQLEARAATMRFMATGEAAPFARVRLPRLLVAGQGIDPRQFASGAPRADLAFSGVFRGQPGERLLGTFSLTNRQAGRLDQDRLPLANLTGAVLGDSVQADFSALEIDLGAAGRLSGVGQWRDGRFGVNLESPRLDLAGLHRALYATRIRARLRLAGDAARQTLTAEVAEPMGQGRFTLIHDNTALRLLDAAFSGQAGQLSASGSLQLGAPRAFSGMLTATGINPARFGKFPRARLNARAQASGVQLPELQLQTQFTLPPGELAGRPVKGQGRLRYQNGHLIDTDIDLDLAGNFAKVKGGYGHAGDRLLWDIDAPALARLNLGLAGRLASTGSASGDPRQPQIDAQLNASGLRLPGAIAADTLALQLKLQAAASGIFDGQLEAHGVHVAGRRIDFARASVQGRRNAHTVALDARLPGWTAVASLSGGLDAGEVWRGQLNQAAVAGAWPMQLRQPTALVLGRGQQQVSNLALTLAGGQISVAQFSRQGAQLATRGTLADVPLTPFLSLLQGPLPFTTDLRVNGDWNLRLADTLDGQATLRRQSGDLRLTDPSLNLGLTTLGLALRADAGRVAARLEADTREAGRLRFDGRAMLERTGAAVAVPRGAPLAWTAKLDVPDLRLVKPFLPVGVRLDSRLAAQLAGSGSLAAPRIDGQIAADAIRFAMPQEGVAITDGTLRLVLAGDRVQVQQGELKGQSGRILVSGEAQLRNPQAGLTLVFEKFAATNRSDRRVTVSGTTRLALDPKRLQLTGELTADRARLEMPEASRPRLSSDVVVVGQPPREKTAQRLPLALDVQLKLGDDFRFKGGGLDARLGGQLHVFTVDQAPRQDRPQGAAAYPSQALRGEGTIQVEQGRYAAYAQNLDIERGALHFVGPIDNPGIDVLAVRKTPTVKAGVQVGGTVQRPVVKLVSDPAMPDTEKLAWLVLGHGLDSGGQQEFMLLQVAAGALLSQTESVNFQAKLAEALRIDSFDVSSGNGENLTRTVVSVGKRLSSRAMLSYGQSLDGLSQVVKVLYQLSKHVRLEAQAGQQSSFDAFYSLDFD